MHIRKGTINILFWQAFLDAVIAMMISKPGRLPREEVVAIMKEYPVQVRDSTRKGRQKEAARPQRTLRQTF
jgi:hypothetical protein